jgi:hypothetical protein
LGDGFLVVLQLQLQNWGGYDFRLSIDKPFRTEDAEGAAVGACAPGGGGAIAVEVVEDLEGVVAPADDATRQCDAEPV